MKQRIFLSIFILAGLNACNKPESPQFKYLENVVIELESLSTANLHAEAVLHNPNKNNLLIKSANIDILMGDKIIAVLDKELNIRVNGQEDFTVPLDVKIKLRDLNLNAISSALGLMGKSGQEIRYLGKIKVKAYGVPFSVKVDYTDNINLRI